MGCKLEAFILNHRAAAMLPDNLDINRHRFTEDWVRHIEGAGDQ